MKRVLFGIGALLTLGWSAPALSGGAFCTPDWRPENPTGGCSNQIAISPGNDSRINLFLLLQDRAGADGAGLSYPDLGWREFYGRNFLNWQDLRTTWYAAAEKREWPDSYGTRCQTVESGQEAYVTALESASGLGAADREFLQVSRSAMTAVCNDGVSALASMNNGMTKGNFFPTPRAFGPLSSPEGAFHSYLEASTSFYADDFQRAYPMYQALAKNSRNEWVTETALYMTARTALNEAIDAGATRWGGFEIDIVERAPAARAERDLRIYLSLYPSGRYAGSANGLIRKAQWLQRDYKRLGARYGALLAEVDPAQREAADLVEEVDDKYLIREAHGQPQTPLLLASDLLMRMRVWSDTEPSERVVTEAELAVYSEKFADHPELFSFLQANHAFYVRGEPREVLGLLPDAARSDSYTPLTFSRQYLRGLALHALKDRNEEGFWRDLIKGSNGIWQRPAVELALARNLEQAGKLDAVFAEDSPIQDQRLRRILLGQSAGIKTLKTQSRASDQPVSERSFALFTAMIKQLQHGQYDGFLDDRKLAEDVAPGSDRNLWNVYASENPPLDFFFNGTWSDGYDCPSLEGTVKRLRRNAKDVKGRLCLGDFYRLNGFDDFGFGGGYTEQGKTSALGERDYYRGDPTPRHDFYTSILSSRRVTRSDRAYALYRAIRCYAPNNRNTCGGAGVAKEQRARWFKQLKSDYASSRWAKDLEYYW